MRVYRDSQSPKSLVSKCFTVSQWLFQRKNTTLSHSTPSRFEEVDWEWMLGQWKRKKMIVIETILAIRVYEGTENCLLVLAGTDKTKQAPPVLQTVKFTFTNLNQQARSGIKHTAGGMSTTSPFMLPSNFCRRPGRSIRQLRMLRMVAKTAREFIILVLSAQQIGLKSHPLWFKKTHLLPPSKALWTNRYPCLACASCQSQPCHLGSTAGYQRA